MEPLTTRAFALPDHLAAKADPALIGDDEQHFEAIARALEQSITDLSERLAATRKEAGGTGQEAMDRDLEVHRLTARLRTLRRFGLDLCLGHVVRSDDPEPVYVGRLGLTDSTGRRLLVDWRSPVAEPFFGATHADPMGLSSRRRYRWTRGRITDYWDEVFTPEELDGHAAALDDQSAFIASLGTSRSPRMRDVLATIQADQDAIIRAGSRGALVVDGGPGTGKTVVALHRTAYLLYSDPRLGHRRGGVLFVGPHQPYLAYVADVLPSLGEEGVQTCTVRELVPEGAGAAEEVDLEVARLKSSAAMEKAIEPAVRFYEEPPTEGTVVETPWSDLWLSADEWAQAFDAPDPGTPHNEAREQVWGELLSILSDKHDDEEVPAEQLLRALERNGELRSALHRAWPVIEHTDLVGDLWSVPAYLRLCAPWLAPDEVRVLQRRDAQAWTVADLPLLDAARQRLGDPEASGRARRQRAAVAAQQEEMTRVVDHLIATDDSDMMIMSMLRGEDLRGALVDEEPVPDGDLDPLAGPFAHVVVDEAQELTDAEWQMLLRRCPSRSLTIVGDRAQARHGFTESWQERLARIGLDHVEQATLTINYRTPEEVMAAAEPVIRAALPEANVPTSVRSSGIPVVHGHASELDTILGSWLSDHHEGIACVVSVGEGRGEELEVPARVRPLAPELAKGLEFDLVVLLDPQTFGEGIEGAVDRYVAMTRATERLVVLTGQEAGLASVTGARQARHDGGGRMAENQGTGVQGRADARLEPVRDVLADQLDHGDELGASIVVDVDGETLLDVWGGWRDEARTQPWTEDTIVNVWSTTKTVTALAALMCVDRGRLDPYEKVATYWPEFAENGKDQIEVRHLMSHTSGVSGWEQPFTTEDMYDWEKSTARLAAQAPWWEPGTASGYHAQNQGHLVGELVRRVSGKGLKQFVADEIARPLGADFQIGAREEDWDRIAPVVPPPPLAIDLAALDTEGPMFKTFTGPAADAASANTPGWRRADMGAINGHGNARSVATILRTLSLGGQSGGVRLLSPDTIDLVFDEQSHGPDLVLGVNLRFGIGMALPETQTVPYVPQGKGCYWGGWGGSLIFCDLDSRTTISYMMNNMASGIIGSDRAQAYTTAILECLG